MPVFKINGQLPEDLGIFVARRELQSMDVSRAILEVADADLFSPELFTYGTQIVITRDDARWFAGKVSRITHQRSGDSYTQSIEIRDPWQDLKETQAEADPDPDLPDQHDTVVSLGAGLHAVEDDTVVAAANVGAETSRLASQLGDLASPVLQVASIVNGAPVVARTLQNASLAEAIADLAKTSPAQVSWFDYTQSPPGLHIAEISSSSEVITLDAADPRLKSARITPRDDLLVREVAVNFVDQSSGESAVAATQQSTLGAGLGRRLVITHAVPGVNSRWSADGAPSIDPSTGLANTPMPAGYAAALLSAYNRQFFEGEITLKDDDIGGTLYMGRALSITGGPSRWATMQAPIIGVTEDLVSGETTLTIGPSRRTDPHGPRSTRPSAPAAFSVPPTSPGGTSQEEPAHDPLETYVAVGTNIIRVAQGLCGLDSDGNDKEVTGTAPDTVATIGLGGEVDVFLGVSFTPDVEAVSVLDADGVSGTEYRPVGTAVVLTADIRTNRASPAAQPAIVNYSTGAVTQNGVFYFHLAKVTWPGGDAPTVQVFRKGNFDLMLVPPNRCYLRVNE